MTETMSFSATRFSRRQFDRKMTGVAGELGLTYAAEVKTGLLLCDIEITVEGDKERVDDFRRYAAGLSAASNTGGGGF